MTALLEIRDARCRIGRQGLLVIDYLQLNRGEHWCIFGPNGAGKSLLGKLLSGQMRESSLYVSHESGFDFGHQVFTVSFEEQQRLWQRDNRLDISEYSADAQDQGTTVRALLESARRGVNPDATRINSLLDDLGLSQFAERGIRFLSSGQVRKALLARALYGVSAESGGLIVLDDPLESIDRQSRQAISDCIQRHLGPEFTSIFLCRRVTDIPAWTTHLALMDGLRLVAQGGCEEVKSQTLFHELTDHKPVLPQSLPLQSRAPVWQSGTALLELRSVSAAYSGKPVLENINWLVSSDDHVLLEGPNGCGKSTLLSLIDGDNHMGYGQDIRLFGKRKGSGESIWELKSHFGIVSNELHNKYVKGFRVLDVVVSGFYDSVGLYDDSGAVQRELALAWLAALQLKDLHKHYYHELSFGQQRMVLLARAMVKSPQILILDEPCVGLDDYHRAMILGMLELIANESSTRLIYVSHVVGEQLECINRRYRFEPTGNGTFTLREVSRSEPEQTQPAQPRM